MSHGVWKSSCRFWRADYWHTQLCSGCMRPDGRELCNLAILFPAVSFSLSVQLSCLLSTGMLPFMPAFPAPTPEVERSSPPSLILTLLSSCSCTADSAFLCIHLAENEKNLITTSNSGRKHPLPLRTNPRSMLMYWRWGTASVLQVEGRHSASSACISPCSM